MDERILHAREAWVTSHLIVIPSLLEHMRDSVVPIAASGTSERVSSSPAPPAPLRLGAADDADELWSYLCDFTDLVATRIGDENPIRTNDRMIRARTPREVHTAASAVVRWLMRATYRIATDAVFAEYFTREKHLVTVVQRAQRVHPLEIRPVPARFRCRECGEYTVIVRFGPDARPTGFECSECGYSGEV